MVNILIINSSPNKTKGKTEIVLEALKRGFSENSTITNIYLSDYKVQKCIKTQTCKIIKTQNYFKEKKIIKILNELAKADIIILGTPLYETGMTIDLHVILGLYTNENQDLMKINPEFFKLKKKNQKWVVVGTCLYPEISNVYKMNKDFEYLAKKSNAELILKIYRPRSDLLALLEDNIFIEKFLDTCTDISQKIELGITITNLEKEELHAEVMMDMPKIIF